jgi:hypothetical protein
MQALPFLDTLDSFPRLLAGCAVVAALALVSSPCIAGQNAKDKQPK